MTKPQVHHQIQPPNYLRFLAGTGLSTVATLAFLVSEWVVGKVAQYFEQTHNQAAQIVLWLGTVFSVIEFGVIGLCGLVLVFYEAWQFVRRLTGRA